MRRFFPVLFLFAVAVIAACGGGGGGGGAGAPAAPKVLHGSASTSISVFVPSAASQGKRAQTIVAGTQSVRIRIYTVGGATPVPQPADTVAQIGPTAPGCTVVNGGTKCTIIVTGVPISSSVVFEILSYASTDGSGTPLASGFVTVDTTQPTITPPPPVALGGVISSLSLSPVTLATWQPATSPQKYQFTVTAKDASGNIILGTGAFSPPVSFAASNDPSGSLSFSPNPLLSPDPSGKTTIALTWDPSKSFGGSTTITATADTVTAKLPFSLGSGGGTITAGYRIFEYKIPTANANAWQITSGPNKTLWFTEHGTDKFGELFPSTCTQTAAPTCTILEGTLGTPTSPTGIAQGHDGNMWIAGDRSNAANHVWTIQTANSTCAASNKTNLNSCVQTAQSPDPNPSMSAYDVRAGTDNLIHIAANVNGTPYIVNYWPVVSPAVIYNAFVSPGVSPFSVDGSGWFTDPGSHTIGLFQCAEGCTTSTYAFAPGGTPEGIVKAPSGDVFVTDAGNNAIQYFDPSSCAPNCTYNQIAVPTANSEPWFLAAGADGNIYFTEANANNIGVVVVSTMSVYEIPIPTPNAGGWGITLGPDGNIWFTENTAGKIGVIVP